MRAKNVRAKMEESKRQRTCVRDVSIYVRGSRDGGYVAACADDE